MPSSLAPLKPCTALGETHLTKIFSISSSLYTSFTLCTEGWSEQRLPAATLPGSGSCHLPQTLSSVTQPKNEDAQLMALLSHLDKP